MMRRPTISLSFLIGVLLLLAVIVSFRVLERQNIPSFVPKTQGVSKPTLKVWVNKRSGLYYCSDSRSYGNTKPGAYMAQSEALQAGYRPSAKEACR